MGYEINLWDEYKRRISKSYRECSDQEREELIDTLYHCWSSEKIEEAVISCFLIHMFMLGLQNIYITVHISDNMKYSSCSGGCFRNYGKNKEVLKAFVYQSEPHSWKTTVSLIPNDDVYDKGDVEVIAAACCRQLYQEIAISQESRLLLQSGSELTRRPEKEGYYSLAYGEGNDGAMRVPSLADLYTYMDSVTVYVPGFAISPVKAADRKTIVIGCGWHASRIIAKTIERMNKKAWNKFWCYFIDPLSESRHWEDFLDVKSLKEYLCPVTAVVAPDRYGRGAGGLGERAAYQMSSITKRYLQEIFSEIKGDETVIICHCIVEYFSNAFVLQCTEFVQKMGLQVSVIPMQVVPLIGLTEQLRAMVKETVKELIRLSETSNNIELLMEENVEERFERYWKEHKVQQRLISYLYQDSEQFYSQRLLELLTQ